MKWVKFGAQNIDSAGCWDATHGDMDTSESTMALEQLETNPYDIPIILIGL